MDSSTKTAGSDRAGILLVMTVIALSTAVYFNTLEGSFVYDDRVYVVNNPYVKGEYGVAATLTSPYYAGESQPTLYRPITVVSYMLDRSLWGMNPSGFHLTNIVIHALCSAIFFLLLLHMLKDRQVALIGGLLFAVHPVHTEAVAWITGRAELLAGAFFLLSFLLYLKARSGSPLGAAHLGSAAIFMLALLSKEAAASLLLILIAREFLSQGPRERTTVKRRILWYLPYFAAVAVYASIRINILGSFGIEEEQQYLYGVSAYSALLHVIKSFGYYLRLFFYPHPLNAQYHIPFSRSLLELPVLLSTLLLIASAASIVFLRRKLPLLSFGVLFFLLALLPVVNIIPIGESVAERFLYIPSMGLSLFAARILGAGIKGSKPAARAAAITAVAAVVLTMSALTYSRNRVWRNDLALFTDTVAKNPGDPKSRYSLGNALINMGRLEEAAAQYRSSILLSERNWRRGAEYVKAYNNLGVAYMRMGRLNEAVAQFQKALSVNPAYTMARENLRLAIKLRKLEEGENQGR